MTSRTRGLLLGGMVLLSLGGGGAWYWTTRQASTTRESTVQVQTLQVSAQDFRITVEGPGSLTASTSHSVKSSVSGTVKLHRNVGDRVKAGDLLAEIDPETYQQALQDAQISLQKAQLQLQSQQTNQSSTLLTQQQNITTAQQGYDTALSDLKLAEQNLMATEKVYAVGGVSAQALQDAKSSHQKAVNAVNTARLNLGAAREGLSTKSSTGQQDLQNARLQVEQARLSVQTAQRNLRLTRITAPIAGVVSSIDAPDGSSVSGNGPVLTLQDDATVKVPVQVDETEISKVQVGQQVEVTLDALPDETFVGTVTQVDPSATISNNIAVFNATVTLNNPERKLRPGMSAESTIIVLEVRDAIVVPRTAIETVRRRSYVQVQTQDGQTESVRVQTGPEDGSNVVVTEGLEIGQLVVLPTTSTARSSGQQGGNFQRNQVGVGAGPAGGLALPLGVGGGR